MFWFPSVHKFDYFGNRCLPSRDFASWSLVRGCPPSRSFLLTLNPSRPASNVASNTRNIVNNPPHSSSYSHFSFGMTLQGYSAPHTCEQCSKIVLFCRNDLQETKCLEIQKLLNRSKSIASKCG